MPQESGSEPPSSGRWRRIARLLHPRGRVDLLERPAAELAAPLFGVPAGAAQLPRDGEQLGPYRVMREVGHGATAKVYLAEDPRHERQVALKVLYPEVAASVGRRRFLQEIKLAARLQHPHILPVFDSGESDGRLWYAMPYVAGETLRHRLKLEPRLPIHEGVRIAREVGLALDYAHRQGIVHRDIKPANILLADGQALVADFGIARALARGGGASDEGESEGLTETGLVIGTPAYMSPEQAQGGETVDGRSDLYSLGCVLYEMLAGEPPFRGPNAASILHQHVTGDAPPVTELRPEVPGPVAGVLARALAWAPEDRYTTAAQFADALAGGPMDRPAVRVPPPILRQWRRSRRVMAVLLGTVTAIILALAYRATTPSRPAGVTVHLTASTIAVLPLVPVPYDTALARLGRELAVTLSANLDGVGGIRAAEALTVLALVRDGETMTPERGAELARQLGARSVLQGTLVREGADVRLDVGLSAADNLKVLSRVTVSARLGDITGLTDSATFAVIKDIWRGRDAPAPSLAAITTHSVPALRAYLDGELALGRAEFDGAVRGFDKAFAADSTFWFAYWRSLYPRVYDGTAPPDSATFAALVEHRHELPEADRLLLESGLGTSMSEHLARLRQITSRFPTYWPGWWDYANYLVHWTPYVGTASEDARAALERTVQLNPGFAPAWEHLYWIAGDQRDTAGAGRALRTLERMSSTTAFRLNPELINFYRVIYRLTASGGTLSDSEVQRQARYIVGYRGTMPPIAFGIGLLGPGFPRGQRQISDAVLALGPGRELAAAMWVGIGFSDAGRGAWDSALVAMQHWVRLTEDSTAPLVAYGLAATGARLGFLRPRAVAAARPHRVPGRPPPTAEEIAELAWLDGILAHTRRDGEGLARARKEVRASGSRYANLLDRSLAAFQDDLAGQRGRAARALAELEWESAEHTAHHDYGRHHPFFNAVNRLTASSWLLAGGDTAQAARLLTWEQGIYWYPQHRLLTTVNKTVAPVALFERARIEASLGQAAPAAALYREFVHRYDLAHGEWARRVEQALAALQWQSAAQAEPVPGAD